MMSALGCAVLTFIGWAVYLGGLASVVELCENDRYPDTFALLDAGTAWECKRYLGLYWWFLAYQLIIILALAGLARKLHYFRSALSSAFAVGFVLFTLAADKFLMNLERVYWDDDGTPETRMKCLIAGCVMLAIFDGITMFVVGMAPPAKNDAHHTRQAGDMEAGKGPTPV